MSHGAETPFFFIFALYFGLILFSIVRNFRGALGRTMKQKTGADGQPYFFSKRKYGKYSLKYAISAGVPVQNGFTFSICRRTLWHRLLTPLGLAQDMKTGDPLLDDAFYFMADDDERLKTLIGSPGFVAALREVFETNQARDVECTKDRLWFNTKPVDFGSVAQKGGMSFSLGARPAAELDALEAPYASQAARLAQTVEKLEAPGYQANAASFPLSRAAFLYRIVHTGFLLLALLLAATLFLRDEDIINTKDFFLKTVSISPIVILLWLSLLMFKFGKTSWFPQVCGSFVLSGLIGLALLTGFVVREADIDLDHAAPDIKTLSLQSKQCSLHCTTGGKHAQTSTYNLSDYACSTQSVAATLALYKRDDYRCEHSARIYYDLFFPWPTEMRQRGRKKIYKLEASAESYEQANLGQPYAFPIHKGYLGLAWIRKGDIRVE